MADSTILGRISMLAGQAYIPSVGSWVQIAPPVTTILNAFNTLGRQSMELWVLDIDGNATSAIRQYTLETNRALRLDLAELVPPERQPFEGSVWVWSKGDTNEGSIGLQAIDLDFVDQSRPAGHVLGSVHIIYDFFNTSNLAPWMDLVTPRVLAARTPEGADRYANYLGVAHVLVSNYLEGPNLQITLANDAGEVRVADPVAVPLLGSKYLNLEALFPDLADFLIPAGQTRGYGVLNVRDAAARPIGLCAMLKVIDKVTGEMLVDHLNDRNFARPAQKEGG